MLLSTNENVGIVCISAGCLHWKCPKRSILLPPSSVTLDIFVL